MEQVYIYIRVGNVITILVRAGAYLSAIYSDKCSSLLWIFS